jgi:hypothetical protein
VFASDEERSRVSEDSVTGVPLVSWPWVVFVRRSRAFLGSLARRPRSRLEPDPHDLPVARRYLRDKPRRVWMLFGELSTSALSVRVRHESRIRRWTAASDEKRLLSHERKFDGSSVALNE